MRVMSVVIAASLVLAGAAGLGGYLRKRGQQWK
jgi:hypothetical protein